MGWMILIALIFAFICYLFGRGAGYEDGYKDAREHYDDYYDDDEY